MTATTTRQLELFERASARSRRRDPSTSAEAAALSRAFSASHESRILEALGQLGSHGGTIHELAAATGLDHVAVARRMKELERGSAAFRNGETRRAPSGVAAAVWRVR